MSTRMNLKNACYVSMLPEHVMSKQVLSFLVVSDVVRLDSALANRNLRRYFLNCLNETVLNGVVDSHYLDWCTVRKCSASSLRITSALNCDSDFNSMSRFKELEVCATADVADHALHQLLADGKCIRILKIQSFECLRLRHLLPLDVDLPLLEINADNNLHVQEDALVALVKRCPHLRVFNARRSLYVTKRLLLALAEYCPHLREVFLTTHHDTAAGNNEEQGSTGYRELFQNCRELQVVDCSGNFTITNMQTLADCCGKLTSVTLQLRKNFEWQVADTTLADAALTALVQNNTHIHTLKLYNFNCFGDVGLLAVAQCLPDLHTLVLDYCQASVTGLTAIRASCSRLRTCEVYDNQHFNWFDKTLQYRYLQMSILITLTIDATTISDAQLLSLAQSNPNMLTLRIGSSHTGNGTVLSPHAICETLSYLPNLEKFDVGAYLAVNHPHPEVLLLDDSMLYALVQHCHKVNTVYISGHTNLGNDAISSLSNLPLLRSLDVSICVNLLDTGLTAIAEGCPLLEEIYLSHCPLITNAGINVLAHYCRRLTNVELQDCVGIEDSAIQNLIRHAPHLQLLDISFTPHFTFAAVAELPLYCFCMRELRLYWSKPAALDSDAAYQNYKHYFDVICGWSKEPVS